MKVPVPDGRLRSQVKAAALASDRFDWAVCGTVLLCVFAAFVAFLVVIGPLIGGDLSAAIRDPTFDATQRGDLPLVAGWLSYVGVLSWWSAATSSLLAAWLLRGRPGPQRLLVTSGLLSAGLGLDDLYLVHDLLWPRATGLSETPMALGWVGAVSIWAFWNRVGLGRTRLLPLLWLAGLAFAASMTLDFLLDGAAERAMLEDSPKLVAVGLWSVFHIAVSAGAVREHLASPLGD